MAKGLKERLLENQFINGLRIKLTVYEEQYQELCELLKLLAEEWRHQKEVDKELAGLLYDIPYIVRNTIDSLVHHKKIPDMVDRLEEIWVELEALVIDCLAGDNADRCDTSGEIDSD